jgi:excisionase family DNA binding protein
LSRGILKDMEEKTVLTAYQVSEQLGCCLRKIYEMLKSGTIPSVKCGDKYLIPKAAFQKWLENAGCQATNK